MCTVTSCHVTPHLVTENLDTVPFYARRSAAPTTHWPVASGHEEVNAVSRPWQRTWLRVPHLHAVANADRAAPSPRHLIMSLRIQPRGPRPVRLRLSALAAAPAWGSSSRPIGRRAPPDLRLHAGLVVGRRSGSHDDADSDSSSALLVGEHAMRADLMPDSSARSTSWRMSRSAHAAGASISSASMIAPVSMTAPRDRSAGTSSSSDMQLMSRMETTPRWRAVPVDSSRRRARRAATAVGAEHEVPG